MYDLAEVLTKMTAWLTERSPEAGAVLGRLQRGHLQPQMAMVQLVEILKPSGLWKEFEAEFVRLTAPSQTVYELTSLKANPPPLTYSPKPGVEVYNPVFEAAIAERAQFDGDVPEFRHGPLTEGMTPAVPVLTDSLDPVEIGMLLERASDATMNEYLLLKESHQDYLEHVLYEVETGPAHLTLDTSKLPAPPTGTGTYRAGEKPDFMSLAPIEDEALHALTVEDRQKYAFKTLSTTQGRRSAVSPIEKAMQARLQELGLHIDAAPAPAKWIPGETPYEVFWTNPLTSAGSIQPKFSYLAVAARSMAQGLHKMIGQGVQLNNATLQVSTVDEISERVVGWRARIVLGGS